jgi:hypothetical protein
MRFWRDMPEGINLKSLAFATNIYVPERGHSFPQWCLQHGLEDFEPCTMQSFAAYGHEMQQRFVPDLEEVLVTNVRPQGRNFLVSLASGESFSSRNVICCTGLSGLSHVPGVLRSLGPDQMKHTFDISNYAQFRNKTVAVIGAGASAIEAGALVKEAGGQSEIFIRGREAVFHGRSPRVRPLWERLKNPTSVLGASRHSWLMQQMPFLIYRLPRERRTRLVKGYLGPASPWWIQERVLGQVPIHAQHELIDAKLAGGRVLLAFQTQGRRAEVEVDFVIAGTGYETDVARLGYLDPALTAGIQCIERSPSLNIHFESSVPGLYFVGPMSFMCFGPLFRFVAGAKVVAPRLARRLRP